MLGAAQAGDNEGSSPSAASDRDWFGEARNSEPARVSRVASRF